MLVARTTEERLWWEYWPVFGSPRSGDESDSTQHPEVWPTFHFEPAKLLAVNLAHTCSRNCFRSINLLDSQAGFILVEVFFHQARLLVVRPDKCLPAVHVIQAVCVFNVVANGLEVGACGELMEGDLIADAPV